ncbi:unnamed protein product, partial [Anisakis simplex]|uniref:Uncharacterized protein n=1 Tax=Anisakis simplex TaxID=6269 RepID=A0A0M3KKQ0_ANISI
MGLEARIKRSAYMARHGAYHRHGGGGYQQRGYHTRRYASPGGGGGYSTGPVQRP